MYVRHFTQCIDQLSVIKEASLTKINSIQTQNKIKDSTTGRRIKQAHKKIHQSYLNPIEKSRLLMKCAENNNVVETIRTLPVEGLTEYLKGMIQVIHTGDIYYRYCVMFFILSF